MSNFLMAFNGIKKASSLEAGMTLKTPDVIGLFGAEPLDPEYREAMQSVGIALKIFVREEGKASKI